MTAAPRVRGRRRTPAIPAAPPPPRGNLPRGLAPGLVAVVTIVPFLPVLANGFVGWDDDVMFVENGAYRGFGLRQLAWMWTTFHLVQYRPLAWMTYGLDYAVWGLAPVGYHLTSLALHVGNAVLVYLLARRLLALTMPALGERPRALDLGAVSAALVFAIHPLRVEPVAWASARGDVLAASLALLSLIAYLGAVGSAAERSGVAVAGTLAAPGGTRPPRPSTERAGKRRSLAPALGLFAASLLAKPSGLALPLVLAVLDVYPLRRLGAQPWWAREAWPIWREKAAFVAVALPIAVVGLRAKAETTIEAARYGPLLGIGLWLYGAAFGLAKTVLPTGLSPLYEVPYRPSVWHRSFLVSALVVVVITAALLALRRRWPAALAAWIVYGAVLAPSSGLVPFGRQLTADRYTYLAALGAALLAGAGVGRLVEARCQRRLGQRAAVALAALGLLVVTGLGALAWRQTEVWRDSETLWIHALRVSRSALAENGVGVVRVAQGRLDEAVAHFEAALAIRPDLVEAQYNWGLALAKQGRHDEAIAHFRRALELNPALARVENEWGLLLLGDGRLDEAIVHFRAALALRPRFPAAEMHWGLALMAQGAVDEAVTRFEAALALDPRSADAHNNLGLALIRRGQPAAALPHLEEAIRLAPGLVEAHNNLGLALLQEARRPEAIARFREAIRLRPGFAQAHNNWGLALLHEGNVAEAIEHFRRALALDPSLADARDNLALALARGR